MGASFSVSSLDQEGSQLFDFAAFFLAFEEPRKLAGLAGVDAVLNGFSGDNVLLVLLIMLLGALCTRCHVVGPLRGADDLPQLANHEVELPLDAGFENGFQLAHSPFAGVVPTTTRAAHTTLSKHRFMVASPATIFHPCLLPNSAGLSKRRTCRSGDRGQGTGDRGQGYASCPTSVSPFSRATIRHPPSAIRHPPSAIRHPPSAIRHPPSAIRHPPSAITSTGRFLCEGAART
jgi:hypothetical protein